MAIQIGSLSQVVNNFTNSLGDIFGGGDGKTKLPTGTYFDPKLGGSIGLDRSKWVGNAGPNPNKVKYGFGIVSKQGQVKPDATYYLDIPPQSISQKEIFATNIASTRKGIIVESEGVVFKDIVIAGTTGIFPGPRGNFNGPRANLSNLLAGPSQPAGVDAETGTSKQPSTKVVSGYEEFLSLRQFFLMYAQSKLEANGNLFLVFINEKDNQVLIVEPLEFTMERSSKTPLMYNYRIVLKSLGSYGSLFETDKNKKSLLDTLSDIINTPGNLAANISAGVGQIQSAAAQFPKLVQGVGGVISNNLRKIQFAIEDVASGTSTILALPSVIYQSGKSAVLDVRDAASGIGASVSNFNVSADAELQRQKLLIEQNRQQIAAQEVFKQQVQSQIDNDSKVPVTRQYVAKLRDDTQSQSDNIADALNLGDPLYNQIKGRTVTENPGPLKIASDDELILLGNVQNMAANMNFILTSNNLFQSDAEGAFEKARAAFTNTSVQNGQTNFNIQKPATVREVVIQRFDSLERIALRELGSALRWPEIVIINNLKPPYISDEGGDGVKRPGDKILVGVR